LNSKKKKKKNKKKKKKKIKKKIKKHQESTSILCSDISSCGNYLVTGSGDKMATLYTLQ